ncbi:hypothetical protein N1851_016085 [Merluccius polli]|uniref:Uncharacterized protein n=1 Tax=Merluccius polli TaxID=89951 RepID=A0AA47MRT8_MERPO|nr:hypothetical protein N1851_016085 [Merluccius polli]
MGRRESSRSDATGVPSAANVDEMDEKAGCVEGFEVGLVSTSRVELVASLTGKMLRSTCHSIQITLHHLVYKSPYLVEQVLTGMLTQAWSLRDLPQYIQHQLMSGILFVCQMSTLVYPKPQQDPPPLRPTMSPKTALNGKSVNHASPGSGPVPPEKTFSNGKHRKRPVNIQSANGCTAACEVMFE